MEFLVISDSHGNLERLKHTMDFAKKTGLPGVIHCGDWDTPEALEVVTKSNLHVYGVLGNADVDPAIASNLKGTNVYFDKDFLEFELAGHKIGVCHFPGKLKDAISSGEYDILFHGHTHRKKDEIHGKTRVVNPGALSRTDSPSFAVYDADKNSVEFVDLVL